MTGSRPAYPDGSPGNWDVESAPQQDVDQSCKGPDQRRKRFQQRPPDLGPLRARHPLARPRPAAPRSARSPGNPRDRHLTRENVCQRYVLAGQVTISRVGVSFRGPSGVPAGPPGRRTWLSMRPSWSSSAPPRVSPLAWTDFREVPPPRARARLRMLLRAASFAPPAPSAPPRVRTDPWRAVRRLKKVAGAYLSLPVLHPSRSEVAQ